MFARRAKSLRGGQKLIKDVRALGFYSNRVKMKVVPPFSFFFAESSSKT